jgi:hypothetical protein
MVSDADMIDERYHYEFIHNVFANFFKDTLDYFSVYLKPRFEWTIVGTFDKAVEYIEKKKQIGRESDVPILPAMILNPTGDFELADANTGARQFWRFPNLAPNMIKRLFDPIYQDNNIIVNVGFTRVKGEIELILLLNSFYEYCDLRIFLIQIFGGLERYIYPRYFNSFIIIPDEIKSYTYNNEYTGTSYKIDWENTDDVVSKLVRSTNRNELVFPCTIKPLYKLTGINDGSEKYGGSDRLAEWKLTATIEYEVEMPSFMLLQGDYLAENINIDIGYGSNYTEYDYKMPAGRSLISSSWDFGLEDQTDSRPTYPDEAEIVGTADLSFKTRYYHQLTDADIDGTTNISFEIYEDIPGPEYIILNSKYGPMEYNVHYTIHNSVTTIEIIRENTQELEAGDILELYIYEKIILYEKLSATVYIESNASADLEYVSSLRSSADIQSNLISALHVVGVAQSLKGTVDIQSNLISALHVVGVAQSLKASIDIQSNLISALQLGQAETLSSTVNIQSDTIASIEIGIAESLSSTSNIISDLTSAALQIGQVESLSGTINITSDLISALQLGQAELLSGTINITSDLTSAALQIGIVESLASTVVIQSGIIATLQIGQVELLSSTSNIISDLTSAALQIGLIESLSSSANIISDLTSAALQIGQVETLSSSIAIQSDLTSAVLQIGQAESLSGTSSINTSDSTAVLYGFTAIPRQTNGDFSEISLGTNIDISQISNTDPAVVTLSLGSNLSINSNFANWTDDDPDNFTVAQEDGSNYITEAGGENAAHIVSDFTSGVQISQVYSSQPIGWYQFSITVQNYSEGDVRIGIVGGGASVILTGTNMGWDSNGVKMYSFYNVSERDIEIWIYRYNLENTDYEFTDWTLKKFTGESIPAEGDFINLSGFGEVLDDDSVTNGVFATDTDWTKGTGWTIAAGVASCDGSQTANSRVEQDVEISTTPTLYKITYDLVSQSAGFVFARLDESAIGSSQFIPDTYTEYLWSDALATGNLRIVGNVDFIGSIDNVTCEKVFHIDDNIYEVGEFTDNTAPLKSHKGDLDLSELAGVTGAGYGQVATLDDWTVGDGVGPYIEVDKTELVTNGDFATDSDWNKGTGWTISGGVASHGGGAGGYLDQDLGLETGKFYILRFDVSRVGGNLLGYIDTPWDWNISVSNSYIYIMEANQSLIRFFPSVFEGSIDNVSIKEVLISKVQVTGSQDAESSMLQNVDEETDKVYDIEWTIADRTAGGVTASAGDDDGTEKITNGAQLEEDLTAINTTDSGLKFSTGFVGTIDDLIIDELIDWET